jgi:mono/diheme cytochrome c family protein
MRKLQIALVVSVVVVFSLGCSITPPPPTSPASAPATLVTSAPTSPRPLPTATTLPPTATVIAPTALATAPAAATSTSAAPAATPTAAAVSYKNDIQPIFTQNCVVCHGGSGGLYLDSYAHVMAGGATGKVVIPGNPDQSVLVERIKGILQPRMPLGRPPLPAADINAIVQWIAEGAPDN